MFSLTMTLLLLCCIHSTIAGLGDNCTVKADCSQKGLYRACVDNPTRGRKECCDALMNAICTNMSYCCGGSKCVKDDYDTKDWKCRLYATSTATTTTSTRKPTTTTTTTTTSTSTTTTTSTKLAAKAVCYKRTQCQGSFCSMDLKKCPSCHTGECCDAMPGKNCTSNSYCCDGGRCVDGVCKVLPRGICYTNANFCVKEAPYCMPTTDATFIGLNECCSGKLNQPCDGSTYCCDGGKCKNGICKAQSGTACTNATDCVAGYCFANPLRRTRIDAECCDTLSHQPCNSTSFCCRGGTCIGGICVPPKLLSGQPCDLSITNFEEPPAIARDQCEGGACGYGRGGFPYACCKVYHAMNNFVRMSSASQTCDSDADCCDSPGKCTNGQCADPPEIYRQSVGEDPDRSCANGYAC